MKRLKSAYTMLELVFVIVILGIISSIGAELITKVYEQYIIQRAQYRASMKTELAALQIANRFSSAIPGTIYRIKNDNSYEMIVTGLTGAGSDYKGIQWIGADSESFYTSTTPGWSGFIDLDASSKNTLITKGSQLSLTDTIISKLYTGKNISNASVFFPNQYQEHNVTSRTGNIQLDLQNVPKRTVSEHYKLAWSSYAVVVENNNLYLYYNFEPSVKHNYTQSSKKQLLLYNVSTFKFRGDAGALRFKICKEEPISNDYNVTVCKEKAVF